MKIILCLDKEYVEKRKIALDDLEEWKVLLKEILRDMNSKIKQRGSKYKIGRDKFHHVEKKMSQGN